MMGADSVLKFFKSYNLWKYGIIFFRKLTWTKVWVLKVQPISYGEMGFWHKVYVMIFQKVSGRGHCRILRNHQICQKSEEKKKSMFFLE